MAGLKNLSRQRWLGRKVVTAAAGGNTLSPKDGWCVDGRQVCVFAEPAGAGIYHGWKSTTGELLPVSHIRRLLITLLCVGSL